MDKFDIMAHAMENGAEAAAGLLAMVGPEGFVGDYAAMETELSGMVESQRTKAATMQEYRGKWEANRETVQRFLDSVRESRREDEARQKAAKLVKDAQREAEAAEALQEAHTADLFGEINFRNAFARMENTVSERNTRREMAQAARRADTRKRKRRAAVNCRNFLIRTVLLAVFLELFRVLCYEGILPAAAFAVPIVLALLVYNLMAFTAWSRKEYEREHEGATA